MEKKKYGIRRVDKDYAEAFNKFLNVCEDLWTHFHMEQCSEYPFNKQFRRFDLDLDEHIINEAVRIRWKPYLKLLTEEQIYIIEAGLDTECPTGCDYECIEKNPDLNVLNAVVWEYFRNMIYLFRSAGRIIFSKRTVNAHAHVHVHYDLLIENSIASVYEIHIANNSLRSIIGITTESGYKYPVITKKDVELGELANQLSICDHEMYRLVFNYLKKNKIELPTIRF